MRHLPSTSELANPFGSLGNWGVRGLEVRMDPLTEELGCCPLPGWSFLRQVLPPDAEEDSVSLTCLPGFAVHSRAVCEQRFSDSCLRPSLFAFTTAGTVLGIQSVLSNHGLNE